MARTAASKKAKGLAALAATLDTQKRPLPAAKGGAAKAPLTLKDVVRARVDAAPQKGAKSEASARPQPAAKVAARLAEKPATSSRGAAQVKAAPAVSRTSTAAATAARPPVKASVDAKSTRPATTAASVSARLAERPAASARSASAVAVAARLAEKSAAAPRSPGDVNGSSRAVPPSSTRGAAPLVKPATPAARPLPPVARPVSEPVTSRPVPPPPRSVSPPVRLPEPKRAVPPVRPAPPALQREPFGAPQSRSFALTALARPPAPLTTRPPALKPGLPSVKASGSNNRKFPRADLKVKARLALADAPDRFFEAHLSTLNISVGGMFLESEFFLKLGTRLLVELTLPPKDRVVKVKGEVVRIETTDGGTSGFALRFTEYFDGSHVALATHFLSPMLRDFIEAFAKEHDFKAGPEYVSHTIDVISAWELRKAELGADVWMLAGPA